MSIITQLPVTSSPCCWLSFHFTARVKHCFWDLNVVWCFLCRVYFHSSESKFLICNISPLLIREYNKKIGCVEMHFKFLIYLFAFNFSEICHEKRLLRENMLFRMCSSFEWIYSASCTFFTILWVTAVTFWFPESLCLIFTSCDLNWRCYVAQSLLNTAGRANAGITRSPKKGEKGFASPNAAQLWAEAPMVRNANLSGGAHRLQIGA